MTSDLYLHIYPYRVLSLAVKVPALKDPGDSTITGMCPGSEDWWLIIMDFSSPKSVIFSFCAQTMPRRFLVDTTYIDICKAAGN